NLRAVDQALPNGILLNVEPFLRILLASSQACVPVILLPGPAFIQMGAAKKTLPKFDPFLECESEIVGCAEEVEMVGHEEEFTDQPGRRLIAPDFGERVRHPGSGHPWNPGLRTHG